MLLKTLLMVAQFLSALCMIGLVLLQHGKGADMGAAFGSGASGSLFGASGSANFLSRTTAVLATVFFASTLGLTFIGSHKPTSTAGVLGAASTESTRTLTTAPAQEAALRERAASKGNAPAPADEVPK